MEDLIAGARWNGEPAQAAKVRVRIPEWDGQLDPRLAWWKDRVGDEVDAVFVLYGEAEYILYDGDGSGLYKVTHGGGPDLGHRDLPNRSILL